MRGLARLWSAFRLTDAPLQERERKARGRASKIRWAEVRQLNEQAYFLKLFAEVEARVDGLCERLFQRRAAPRARGRSGRVWQFASHLHDGGRLPFMDRVAILVDRGSADYRDIGVLYKLRCDIAHGDPRVAGIGLPAKYQDLRRLARLLRVS